MQNLATLTTNCAGITDQLVIPGGTRPSWGPASVAPGDGCGSCGTGTTGTGTTGTTGTTGSTSRTGSTGTSGTAGGHLKLTGASVKVTGVRGDLRVNVTVPAAGALTVSASTKSGRRHHLLPYGEASARPTHAGPVHASSLPARPPTISPVERRCR
ncbi:MAG: hypothetical protein ACYDHH_16145 [Solirubrobacteraceae bacterium]